MATIINNPDSGSDKGSGVGMIVGAIVLVLVLTLFFIYGLPVIRNSSTKSNGSTINVPDKIDVNVDSGATGQ